MAKVTTCRYCRREVGLINEKPTPRSLPRPPRMTGHAAEDKTPSGKGTRPRCVKGSHAPTGDQEIRESAHAPSARRRSAAAAAAV